MKLFNTHNIKVGIVGLGYWGKNILRNLHELDIASVACDSNPEIIEVRKKNLPEINYTISFDNILDDKDIQAVIISTPVATHYELAKKALNKGKDVFVEKPLALRVDEGRKLVELASSRKKILMVGHILQYHPAVIKLKELIEKGEFGKIEYIYSNRLNIGKLRIEETILWSFAPHDISAILMLVGDEPIRINCFGGDYLNKNIHDVTLTTLEFENDIKAHIFVSWLHPFKEQKLIVIGSKGMAVFDDLSKEKLFVYPHKIEWKDGKIPIAYKAKHYPVKVDTKEPLKEEIMHFLECVVSRKKPKTDGEEGLKVLNILEVAEKSIVQKSGSSTLSDKERYFVHSSSFIDENVEIGEGTKIWHFSHILKNTKISKNCIIGQNVTIGSDVVIGHGCKVQNNVSIYKGVTLEDEVFCGPSCVFTNVYNPRAFIERKHEFLSTLVKKRATIGANATIVCGVTIGKYGFVGAGAVVKNDVPDYGLVIGVPAKLKGYVCECGTTLKFLNNHAKCNYCGNEYRKNKKGIKPITEKW